MEKYELKQSSNLDWNFYVNQFPQRYLRESRLDFELHKIVSDILLQKEWVRILDVGGGPNFTVPLRRIIEQSRYNDDVQVCIDLLDPFVVMNERKYNLETEQVTWDHIHNVAEGGRNSAPRYDLIVCRGAINYLTLHQIETLGCCLNSGGLLIANSFREPVEVIRKFYNEDDEEGQESCTNKKVGEQTIMCHRLEIGKGKVVIEHESYYHEPMAVMFKLGPEGVTIQYYGENSVLYQYRRQ